MKIIVLHGEDIQKSSNRLDKFIETAKSRSWEISYLDESDQKIQDNLSAGSLFSNERFFILADVKKLGSNELKWLQKKYSDLPGTFIIYNEGLISSTLLKNLPKGTKVEEFKLPKLIWNFLDHLVPGNSKKSIYELHKLVEREPIEFAFSLIAKLFRDLYWVDVEPESIPYPSWRTAKLKSQASKFTKGSIKEMVEYLSTIDVDAKTGSRDLLSSLDLLILTKLQ